MPRKNQDCRPSNKNQPAEVSKKAREIANELLLHGAEAGLAIASGLKLAEDYFACNGMDKIPARSFGTDKETKLGQ